MDFKVKLKRGNSTGTGMIRLPKEVKVTSSFVSVEIPNSNIEFKTKIRFFNNKPVIYIPKNITKLLNDEFIIRIKDIEGNYVKVGPDGRIYLKKELIKKYNLKPKSIIKIFTKDFSKFVTVNYRKRKHTEEYMCMVDPNLANKIIKFEIENNNEKPKIHNLESFLPKARISYLRDKAVVSIQNARIILVASNIPIEKYAYYLGAYFADGTKKGNSWTLCASSITQANYYLKRYGSIILDPQINFTIVYTNFKESNSEIERKVKSYWEKISKKLKLRIIESRGKNQSKKTNKFGTLVIKENSRTIVKLYNALLSEFFKLIKKSRNKTLARMFILGVLEGDGNISSKGHGHLMITTNSSEVGVLKSLLDISELSYRINMEENRAHIRINALCILENLIELEPYIFRYYPKRRKLFCQRFCNNIGACRFLLGKQSHISSWVKSKLCKENILSKPFYRPTALGKKIINILEKLNKEVQSSKN